MTYFLSGLSLGIMLTLLLFSFAINNEPPKRDYQISVDIDSVYIFDGKRKVGAYEWEGSKLDSLIFNDNQ